MESLADAIALVNPMNDFNRFLILMIAMPVFAVIILLALKYILTYLHKTLRKHEIEKLPSLCSSMNFNVVDIV